MDLTLSKDAVANALYCTAGLAANLLYCQMVQGKARFASGERAPEDSVIPRAKAFRDTRGIEQNFTGHNNENSEANLQAKDVANRATRVHMNALENVPIGLFVGWGTALACGKANTTQMNLFKAFVALRWVHSVSYNYGNMPTRVLSWAAGWASIIGMLFTGIKSISA